MGTNYNQYCIVGIKLHADDIRHVVSPDEFEEQPRYDTKTGKVSHLEKVLVKKESVIMKYRDFQIDYDSIFEFGEELVLHYKESLPELTYVSDQDNDYVVIGLFLLSSESYGRVELLEGSSSISEIQELATQVANALNVPIEDIGLHHCYYIG